MNFTSGKTKALQSNFYTKDLKELDIKELSAVRKYWATSYKNATSYDKKSIASNIINKIDKVSKTTTNNTGYSFELCYLLLNDEELQSDAITQFHTLENVRNIK